MDNTRKGRKSTTKPRVTFNCRVAPETLAKITQVAAEQGISRGRLMDETFGKQMNSC